MQKTDFAQINLAHEKKVIAYLLKNPKKYFITKSEYFLNPQTKALYKAFQNINENNTLNYTESLLLEFANKYDSSLTQTYFEEIKSNTSDLENINYSVTYIKEGFYKQDIAQKIRDAYIDLSSYGTIDSDQIQKIGDEIAYTATKIKQDVKFLTSKDLSNKYKEVLKERKKGIRKRSLGYASIDKSCIRIAEPGEMTLLFGPSGMGKSAISENIISSLVAKGTPLIKFGLEMPWESEMDRKIAISLNLPASSLYDQNLSSRAQTQIDRMLNTYSTFTNYIHVEEANLSISDMSNQIQECKYKFLEEGVISSLDDYVVVVIDLASMAKDVSGKYSEFVDQGVDNYLISARKNKVHKILIVQANENKMRSGLKFKTAEDLDNHVLAREDIKGGAGWYERCRLVLALFRPLAAKQQYFPERQEEWEISEDILWLHAIKNNHGPTFRVPFVFMPETYRVLPRYED